MRIVIPAKVDKPLGSAKLIFLIFVILVQTLRKHKNAILS